MLDPELDPELSPKQQSNVTSGFHNKGPNFKRTQHQPGVDKMLTLRSLNITFYIIEKVGALRDTSFYKLTNNWPKLGGNISQSPSTNFT